MGRVRTIPRAKHWGKIIMGAQCSIYSSSLKSLVAPPNVTEGKCTLNFYLLPVYDYVGVSEHKKTQR